MAGALLHQFLDVQAPRRLLRGDTGLNHVDDRVETFFAHSLFSHKDFFALVEGTGRLPLIYHILLKV